MALPTGAVRWSQTFKRGGAIFKGAQVSVYLSGTTTPAVVYDIGGIQRNTAPQLATDAIGSCTFYLNPEDFCSGQLFTVEVQPNLVCCSDDIYRLENLQILQDTEGGRSFHQSFFQDSAPTKTGNNLRDGDSWTDSNYDNHPYRWNDTIEEWVSIRDGSIQLVGYSHGIFAETWEGSDRLNYWTNYSGSGSLAVTQVADSVAGGYVLRVGDNSGNDQVWLIFNSNIPFDPTRLYRIKLRVRRTAGSGTIYCGFAGVGADGSIWVNVNGADLYGSQHYHCVAAANPGDTAWHEYEGYTYGSAATGDSTAGTVTSPSQMHENVRYIRPLILVNYNGAAGTTDIDSIIIEALPPDADYIAESTTQKWAGESGADITGDHTSADTNAVDGLASTNVSGWADSTDPSLIDGGVITNYIQSTNYVSGSAGLKFDLDNAELLVYEADGLQILGTGSLKVMAGSNPNIKVVYDGATDFTSYLYAGNGYGEIGVWGSLTSELYFSVGSVAFSGSAKQLALSSSVLYPYYSCGLTLGSSSKPFGGLWLGDGLGDNWEFKVEASGALCLYLGSTKLFTFDSSGGFWTKKAGDGSEGAAPGTIGWVSDFD